MFENTPYSQYRIADIENNIQFFPMDIMLVGATGVGKSTTLNALLGEELATIGNGPDPETKEIHEYLINKYIRIWDTPGLGDSPDNDISYINNIGELLNREYTAKNKSYGYVIDLVLILVDASTRDMGIIYTLMNDVVFKNIDFDRVLLVINQADMAMKGRHWKDDKPDETLTEFLDEKAKSVQERIKETTGHLIRKPLCYSASNKFNLYSLMDYIIDNFNWEQRKIKSNFNKFIDMNQRTMINSYEEKKINKKIEKDQSNEIVSIAIAVNRFINNLSK
jgi:predicted GTPase